MHLIFLACFNNGLFWAFLQLFGSNQVAQNKGKGSFMILPFWM